jgi:hypothetical protein
MAGLEVVVRPVVFPSIRPAPARALAPEDNPDKGIATFSGSGGRLIDLPHSFSVSLSKQKQQTESTRVVDVTRIHQLEKDGTTVNKDNYVDVEIAKKSRFETEDGNALKMLYGDEEWDKQVPINWELLVPDKVIHYVPEADASLA